MLTPQDVRSVQFEKNLRGYRTEDVDRFLDKVEEQLRDDDAQAEQLRKQIADLTAENQKLHDELKSFEADGEMLKSALINAQRMGENVIREANQKAEEIIHRANLRGDDIIRDANGIIYEDLKDTHCKFCGAVDTAGYTFDSSIAVVDSKFVGLPIDEVNEDNQTEERISAWAEQVKQEIS